MLLEADIDGESLIGSVILRSKFPLVSAHGIIPPVVPAPSRAWNSYEADLREKLAVVLIQHVGLFGWASLDKRTDFLSFPVYPICT